MNRSEQDQLLKEILAGDDATAFRQASIEFGVASLRARQKRRSLVGAGMLASGLKSGLVRSLALPGMAVAGLALASILFFGRREPTTSEVVQPVPATGSQSAAAPSQIKFITDEELLARFPGRPVALIGKPG